ncbi:phosphatidylglycerol lysyltransferase [Panacagrimonas perspica]|uniref:Phosphatidylglycerol lysyltransferase n=1 Tax=Panacagrimonas perspica TaxID=381431 RepID=A0A4R7PFP9_9GAMM|nr:bifunctional lysylphosphatidylglycerol flippase/synthetase MprF [Panacagrimonas perspica]TDU32200.1 phosphatidylglycerol lysyltransferase [Panacagrimonas perspica]
MGDSLASLETEVAPAGASRLKRWTPWLLGFAFVALGALCFEALKDMATELRYEAVVDAIHDTDSLRLVLAGLATALSYFLLTGYDYFALRYVGAVVPYRVAGQAAFIAYALSNSIGLGVLTGGAVRLRLYGAAGIEPERVGRAIAFNALCFGLGVGVVGALSLMWAADAVAPAIHVPAWLVRGVAAAFLVAIATLVWMCRNGGERRFLGRITIQAPALALTLPTLLISAFDIAASAMVLWVLLPEGSVDFAPFLAFYAVAVVLGILSHLPGGIGVFEAVMLLALGGDAPPEDLAGALVLYRVIYYVLPLMLALAWLVIHELRRARETAVVRAMVGLTPTLMAALTLIVGTMLLMSGVTPATVEATTLLALHVPLPVVEAAHFLGSIAGLAMLFVARGMIQRIDAAWWAGVALGLLSLVLALPKGIAVNEALVLTGFVALLSASRRQFTRHASLLAQPFSTGWTAAIVAILATVTLLLFMVYRDVPYTQELWWEFEFDAHAPRSLRALLAVALLALAFGLRQLFRPASPTLQQVDRAALDRAALVVSAQDKADAGLALMGDKQLLFSESGKAFVMYGRRGRSWVGLFDPIGPENEVPELIWRFLEQAREAGGRASFYQVRPEYLPHYLDAGLRPLKLGEHASVDLPSFTLKGSRRANLRQGVSRGEREGLTFEVIPADDLRSVIAELRAVSDAWLREHRAAEKSFSLGAFAENYVLRQPVAITRHNGRLVAFATLMVTDRKIEASVDLMRHLPDAPKGTMDFLFVKVMLYFQTENFQRFGLGMAPLSGMVEHPLAPNWHRLGRLLFSHGEHFYNFQGLRAFKEKFDPQWQPRYLAAPGGVAPLLVLADTAALISGGLRSMVSRQETAKR